jgi:hypothetical protein
MVGRASGHSELRLFQIGRGHPPHYQPRARARNFGDDVSDQTVPAGDLPPPLEEHSGPPARMAWRINYPSVPAAAFLSVAERRLAATSDPVSERSPGAATHAASHGLTLHKTRTIVRRARPLVGQAATCCHSVPDVGHAGVPVAGFWGTSRARRSNGKGHDR